MNNQLKEATEVCRVVSAIIDDIPLPDRDGTLVATRQLIDDVQTSRDRLAHIIDSHNPLEPWHRRGRSEPPLGHWQLETAIDDVLKATAKLFGTTDHQ